MAGSGKILITGAAGFVGTALCRYLLGQGYELRVLLRRGGSRLASDLAAKINDVVEFDDAVDDSFWAALLTGVDRVVHLAARTHVGGRSAVPDLYFRDNLEVTVALARAALNAGVKKFIFLSTIKVNGDGVLRADHKPYKVSDRPHPKGAYAVSKWRAEQELNTLFCRSEVSELVILRPPMIYGAGAKGNIAILQKWLSWGLPLPVSSFGNHRSLLALDCLVKIITDNLSGSAIIGGKLLLPCDREDWSTERLAAYFAQKIGCRVRTLKIPGSLLYEVAILLKRKELFAKVFGSLRIDYEGGDKQQIRSE